MNILHQHFRKSLSWNILESTIYHAVLCAHQIALFCVIPVALYGRIGTLFALLYCAVNLANSGLAATLPLFFPVAITSRKGVRLLLQQLIPEVILILGIFLYGLYCSFSAGIDLNLIVVFGLLLITEGMRKTMRVLLQLLFLAKEITFIELCALMCYVSIVWLQLYLSRVTLSELSFLWPLLITSLGAALAKGYLLYTRWYVQLPESKIDEQIITSSTLMTQRFLNYSTQLSHILFSHNFFIPLFAFHYGFAPAGYFKIISTILTCISTTIKQSIGIPSAALFANLRAASLKEKRSAFMIVAGNARRLLLYALSFSYLVLLVMSHSALCAQWPINYPIITLFIALALSEHAFLAYELLFTAEGKAVYNCLLSLSSLTILAIAMHYAQSSSLMTMLGFVLVIRLLTYIGVNILAFRLWNTQPAWTHKETQYLD